MQPRNIVVTGASSGLGAGLALSYAVPGTTLGLVGRNRARLAETVTRCEARGATVHSAVLDVGEPTALGTWLQSFDAANPVDLVVANAGISGGPGAGGDLEGLALATAQVRINLLGVMHTVEPLLPGMLARRAGQVAVVASAAALRGLPYSPAYSASKAGVRAYGEGLRALLRPRGVRVSVIVPGFFDSRMTDRFQGGKPFLISTARAVTIVRRGLDRGQARIVFPRLLALGLQATDLLPAWLGDAILRHNRFHIDAPVTGDA
jgi:short-subunit dehydrogenase